MKPAIAVSFALLLASSLEADATQLNGSDDFDDNQKDPAKWAATDTSLFNGRLSETGSRLEFSVVNASTSIDLASRSWTRNTASTTNDWFARVRIHVPEYPLFNSGQGYQLALGLVVQGNPGNNVGLNLRQVLEGAVTERQYQGVVQSGGIAIPGQTAEIDRPVDGAWVQFRYDSGEMTLHLEYGSDGETPPATWTSIASYDLYAPEINWQLTSEDAFIINLAGTAFSYRVESADELWFDDFEAASLPVILEQPQSVFALPGESAQFSVMADAGDNPQFQWRFNGEDLPGETSPSLALTDIESADYGFYSVRVTNPAGSIVSDPAELFADINGCGSLFIQRTEAGILILICDHGLDNMRLEYRDAAANGAWTEVPRPYEQIDGNYRFEFPATEAFRVYRAILIP